MLFHCFSVGAVHAFSAVFMIIKSTARKLAIMLQSFGGLGSSGVLVTANKKRLKFVSCYL